MTNTDNPIEAVRARLDGGRKWHKGGWGDGAGNVCLLGAVIELNDTCDVTAEERLLSEVVTEQYADRLPGLGVDGVRLVPEFNDHPDTTWPDVDLVLDKAARRWDEQVQS